MLEICLESLDRPQIPERLEEGTRPRMNPSKDRNLIEQLSRSQIYQEYEKAFVESTELPLTLRPVEVWNVALRGKKNENPFCALLAQTSKTCAACLEVQQKISESNQQTSVTSTCFAGLTDTAVPVYLGEQVIGFLQTGQVALKKTSRKQFDSVAKRLVEWGSTIDLHALEEAYFHSRVITPRQYQSMVKLLEIFARHLSVVSNQISVQQMHAESPLIQRAKAYVEQHKSDSISLDEIAKTLNISSFYFCKMFKKATGLHFTEYVSRVRIEKAKNLLLNPHLRVSEIAFAVGFQSLTHFNRVFQKLTGQSPTEYRRTLPDSC